MAREPYEYGVKVGTIVEEIETHVKTLESQLSAKLTEPEQSALREAMAKLTQLQANVEQRLSELFTEPCAPGEYQPPPPPSKR